MIPGVEKILWKRDRPPTPVFWGFPYGSAGKESGCNAGDLGSIPGLGRSPGEGKGYPLQYSGIENSMDCITRLSNFKILKKKNLFPGATKALGKVGFLPLEIEWSVPEQTFNGLSLTTFSLLSITQTPCPD